jgi:DNA-binding XRE family transcriptional regulator
MGLSNEIKMIRQQAFLTQEAFAKELRVAFSTVNRWESGKTHPNMSAMKKINEFCISHDISFEQLQNAWLSQSMGRSRELCSGMGGKNE